MLLERHLPFSAFVLFKEKEDIITQFFFPFCFSLFFLFLFLSSFCFFVVCVQTTENGRNPEANEDLLPWVQVQEAHPAQGLAVQEGQGLCQRSGFVTDTVFLTHSRQHFVRPLRCAPRAHRACTATVTWDELVECGYVNDLLFHTFLIHR